MFTEPYEWDVCIPCNHDVKHAWNFNCCLHQNWFHGHTFKSLSPFWHHLCLHEWVSTPCLFFSKINDWHLVRFWELTVEVLLCRKKIQQRLALYQGVCPIYMEFSDDAEDTFTKALATLLVNSKGSLWKKTICSFLFYIWKYTRYFVVMGIKSLSW